MKFTHPSLPAENHIKIIILSKNLVIIGKDSYAGMKSNCEEISSTLDKVLKTIKFTK